MRVSLIFTLFVIVARKNDLVQMVLSMKRLKIEDVTNEVVLVHPYPA